VFSVPVDRTPRRKTCFTHYETLDVYFEGLISEDELAHVPSSLSEPGTLAHARVVEAEIAARIGLPV
jgi:hypothetical protein